MLKYLSIKKRDKAIYLREKPYKMCKDNLTKEKYISKNKNILILGLEGAGKSKELNKLYDKRDILFNTKQFNKSNILMLNCNDSLTDWINIHLKEEIEEYLEDVEYNTKSMFVKIQALLEYAKNSILMIDDIHKASGRKLEVLKELIRNSRVWYITARKKHHINKTLLKNMGHSKNYFELNLQTNQAQDVTNVVFFVFLGGLILTGNVEMALLVTAGKLLVKQGGQK